MSHQEEQTHEVWRNWVETDLLCDPVHVRAEAAICLSHYQLPIKIASANIKDRAPDYVFTSTMTAPGYVITSIKN